MGTIRTPEARLRLIESLQPMEVGTISSRSQTKRSKRQNEGRERSCHADRPGMATVASMLCSDATVRFTFGTIPDSYGELVVR